MQRRIIANTTFGGERPLFASRGLRLEGVTILAGESALKEAGDIEAVGCRFEGKYPFWHVDGLAIRDCRFAAGARAALWYSRGVKLTDTLVEAPKTLRELDGVELENVRIADYRQQGLYSFQYCRRVEIRNAVIRSKDAFWNTEDVTVCDSELSGEYLGWYSRNLRLVRCRISGTQPLCYAENLVMEHCVMADDCDRAFEGSSLRATIDGPVRSVTNPRSGSVAARGYGEIVLDGAAGDCRIEVVK